MRDNLKILKKSVKILIIALLTMRSLTQFMTKLTYFSKKKSLN